MSENVLENEVTQPSQLRDFFEWHKGIKHYGFWAIEITDQACLDKVLRYQQLLTKHVHNHYSRQPHITLMAAGLLSENHFSQNQLEQQIHALKHRVKERQQNGSEAQPITPFPLSIKEANTFTTCPYLSIFDPFKKLQNIRSLLLPEKNEDSSSEYIPHITLGLYNDRYKISDILAILSETSSTNKKFMVNEIVFAQYKTNDIQGPYEVLHRIKLSSL